MVPALKRDDLQGIRGLAIIAVLGFHFFPKWFPNGYIGVDMFFVLSGFLMTMIFGSKPINSESVYQFYFRRAKRILPLYLLIILIGSILVFLVFPNTFISMNMDSAWNSIFLYHNMAEHSDNNMYFKMLNQAEDIFTHTWSLCVEMQFYLLAPVIFFLLSFFKNGKMMAVFHFIIIITSLGAHLFSTEQAAFNNVFCRVWQFSIGSVAFFLSNELIDLDTKKQKYTALLLEEPIEDIYSDDECSDKVKDSSRQKIYKPVLYILLWFSFLLLLFLSFASWKIPASLLRTTCTFLSGVIILTGTLCEINPMKNRVLVYLGDISYCLYLVHWPIYVYIKHYYEDQFQAYIIGLIFSILVAMAISETFEKWYLKLDKKEIVFMILLFYLSIVLIILKQNEFESFIDNIKYGSEDGMISHNEYDNVTLEEAIKLNKKWARDEYKMLVVGNCFPNISLHGFCEFDKTKLTGERDVFLVGNSLTPNLAPLVYETFGKHTKNMYMYSYSFCEVLTIADENRCQTAHETYKQMVFQKKPDVLFMLDRHKKLHDTIIGPVENDTIFLEALDTLKQYEQNVKRKIYLLGTYTPPPKIKLTGFAKLLEEGKEVSQDLFLRDLSYTNGDERLAELVKRCSKCELMKISDFLFNGTETKSYDEKTKLGYYYDGHHLTPFAMNMILPLFQNVSKNFH